MNLEHCCDLDIDRYMEILCPKILKPVILIYHGKSFPAYIQFRINFHAFYSKKQSLFISWVCSCYIFKTLVKTFEVCDLPVRAAKFVARKNWVVTGAVSKHVNF